jgi:Kazal-type serine protease inhibitor domain
MLKRAYWFGVAAAAALLGPLALAQWGCQGTCASNGDCSGGQYCSEAVGTCLSAQPLGFCKSLPTSCPSVNEAVCGCDGKQYANPCEAARAGVSAGNTGACTTTCGGASKVACPDSTTYCHFADGVCSAGNATGTCDPIPTTCAGAAAAPVCGCDGKTYASLCEAQLAGTSVAASGACACGGSANTPCETGKFCNLAVGTCALANPSGACTVPPATCEAFSDPVCGCDGKTYDNACEAAKASISVVATGTCPCGGPGGATCEDGGYCDFGLMGACLGPDPTGACQPKPTACTPVVDYVCGCDGNTYLNICEAAKQGISTALVGACPSPDAGTDGG